MVAWSVRCLWGGVGWSAVGFNPKKTIRFSFRFLYQYDRTKNAAKPGSKFGSGRRPNLGKKIPTPQTPVKAGIQIKGRNMSSCFRIKGKVHAFFL